MLIETPDGPERPRRPDFEAQHRPDRDFPIYDSRVLRLAPEVPDYTVLSDRDLAALAAAYAVEAIACRIMLRRADLRRREGIRREIWRDRWECAALPSPPRSATGRGFRPRRRFSLAPPETCPPARARATP